MKVYVVTAGEYSDYHIEKVFLDKKKAESYALINSGPFSWQDCEIEEYDTYDDEYVIPQVTYWHVQVKASVYVDAIGRYATLISDEEAHVVDERNEDEKEFYIYDIVGMRVSDRKPGRPLFKLNLNRWYPTNKDTEETARARCEKAAYDIATRLENAIAESNGELNLSLFNSLNAKLYIKEK